MRRVIYALVAICHLKLFKQTQLGFKILQKGDYKCKQEFTTIPLRLVLPQGDTENSKTKTFRVIICFCQSAVIQIICIILLLKMLSINMSELLVGMTR